MMKKVIDYCKQNKEVCLITALEILYLLLIVKANGMYVGINIFRMLTIPVGFIVLTLFCYQFYQKKWDNRANLMQCISMLTFIMMDTLLNRSFVGVVALFYLFVSTARNGKKEDLHDFRKGVAGILFVVIFLEIASVCVLSRRACVDWRLNPLLTNGWMILAMLVMLTLYRISLSIEKVHLITRIFLHICAIGLVGILGFGIVDYMMPEDSKHQTMRENEYAIIDACNHTSALTLNGALLTFERYEEWDKQKFFIYQQEDGDYYITNQDDSYHMDIYHAYHGEGNQVNFWEKGEANSQRWFINELLGGYVQFETYDAGMYARKKRQGMQSFFLLTENGKNRHTKFVLMNEKMRDGFVGAMYDDRALIEYIIAIAMCVFLWLVDRNVLNKRGYK